jgi:hypothetical protein
MTGSPPAFLRGESARSRGGRTRWLAAGGLALTGVACARLWRDGRARRREAPRAA